MDWVASGTVSGKKRARFELTCSPPEIDKQARADLAFAKKAISDGYVSGALTGSYSFAIDAHDVPEFDRASLTISLSPTA